MDEASNVHDKGTRQVRRSKETGKVNNMEEASNRQATETQSHRIAESQNHRVTEMHYKKGRKRQKCQQEPV